MDVRTKSQERVFSILNDNDCPSFVIRQRRSSQEPQFKSQPSSAVLPSPKQRRPSLVRQAQYHRSSSVSSTSSSSPPLLRYNSSSSKSSSSSMESSPSPITPAYNYNDGSLLLPYDNILRQDVTSLMPSPSTVTPFMEQQLMMTTPIPDAFAAKALVQALPQSLPQNLPGLQYPLLPAPLPEVPQQLPTPTSLNSAPSSLPASAVNNSNSPPNATPTKKNKYPCPYSQSHNCTATFTTSGHAARHGKKHTGEKGVHCPICNKAFTRKDNMKQHERTHKNNGDSNKSEENPRRSKAAITRDAQRNKMIKKSDSTGSDPTSQPSVLQSPLSEVTSIAASIEPPMPVEEQTLYPIDRTVQIMPAMQMSASLPDPMSTNPIYPAMTDEALLAAANNMPLSTMDKMAEMNNLPTLPMPPLIRGFSDLDTLAQAAETFDPYYQQPI